MIAYISFSVAVDLLALVDGRVFQTHNERRVTMKSNQLQSIAVIKGFADYSMGDLLDRVSWITEGGDACPDGKTTDFDALFNESLTIAVEMSMRIIDGRALAEITSNDDSDIDEGDIEISLIELRGAIRTMCAVADDEKRSSIADSAHTLHAFKVISATLSTLRSLRELRSLMVF